MGRINLVGNRYGRLTVLSDVPDRKGRQCLECKCSCGNIVHVLAQSLKGGLTASCGCITKERLTKHGDWKTPTYHVWESMRGRCKNPKHQSYHGYGARGIDIDPRWDKYVKFLADMGYSKKGLSLDRIDNNKGYSKENCRWATKEIQSNNKRTTVYLTFKEETYTLTQWAKLIGVHYTTIQQRLKYKWSIEKALTTPIGKYCRKKDASINI